jgi:peptide/nickel transport system substrate-binding protein
MLNALNRRHLLQVSGAGLASSLLLPSLARAQNNNQTLRAVMHAPLRATDPVINNAWTGRNHGLNIYDTLFATDSSFNIKPQMLEAWETTANGLLWTFRLRPGLKFHDGAPVTSADVIASLQRWGKRDTMGMRMMTFVAEFKAVDQRTFQMVMKSPYGLVLQTLGKNTSLIPFILPARLANTPADKAITEFVGSGPFRFVPGEFRPGSRAVYERNADYVPRQEAADGMAGGKLVKIQRYEWIGMPDMQTATNALVNGEIDYLETLPHDLIPIIGKSANIALTDYNPLGLHGICCLNWLSEPFNVPEIRQAAMYASSQEDWLDAQVGNPDYYDITPSMYGKGTPMESNVGWDAKPDLARARDLLKKGGYKGQPVVLLQGTDSPILSGPSVVTAQKLRAIGMNVKVETMDWGSVLARRVKQESTAQGGWSMFHFTGTTVDYMNPVNHPYLNTKGRNGGHIGWSEDVQIDKLRDQYALEPSAVVHKALAEQIQKRAYEVVTHIPTGQLRQPAAHSTRLKGILKSPAPLFWNVEKV